MNLSPEQKALIARALSVAANESTGIDEPDNMMDLRKEILQSIEDEAKTAPSDN